MKGALATRSPSGANNAHEKSKRSLIFVLIEVCCSERPIASATLIKRFAKSVSKIGSGPLKPDICGCRREMCYNSEMVKLRWEHRLGAVSRDMTKVGYVPFLATQPN